MEPSDIFTVLVVIITLIQLFVIVWYNQQIYDFFERRSVIRRVKRVIKALPDRNWSEAEIVFLLSDRGRLRSVESDIRIRRADESFIKEVPKIVKEFGIHN